MTCGVCGRVGIHRPPTREELGLPGKFEGNSDEALAENLYEMSLDGSWRSLGEADGFGWFGLIADGHDADRYYILNEDSQGFVTIVEGPMSEPKANEEWADLEAEWERWNQEGD